MTGLQSCFSTVLIGLQFRFLTISLQRINATVPVGNSAILSPRQKFPVRSETAAPSFAAFEPFALVSALVAVAVAVVVAVVVAEPVLAALERADAASSQPFSTR